MTALNLVEITRKKPDKACTRFSSIPATSAAVRATSIRQKRSSSRLSAACAIWQRLISFAATSSSKLTLTSWALLKDKKRKAEWERELKRTLYFEASGHPNREVFSILSYAP